MTLCYLAGFTKIFSKRITLNKPIQDKDLRIVPGDFRKLYIIDINDINPELHNNPYLNLYDIPKTEYFDGNVRSFYYFSEYTYYPYLDYLSVDEMKEEPLKIITKHNAFIREEPNNYKTSSLIAKLEKKNSENDLGNAAYYMTYYMHNKIIENVRKSKPDISRTNLLTCILINQKNIDLTRINNESLDEIISETPCDKNNFSFVTDSELLKNDFDLYNYQKADIAWMRNIEDDVLNGNNLIKYEYSSSYGVLDNQFLLHKNTLHAIYFDMENYKTSVDFKYYGGNIISEVGLGKTLIMLYHILCESKKIGDFYSRYVEYTDHCNYFYKRGKSKGQGCLKSCIEGSLYCKEHKRTPFTDKRSINYRNLDSFDITNYLYIQNHRQFIKTNASIIICPNHLCDQWIQEYYSKFNATHRIVLIVTSDQYNNVTLGDLLFADIVIVSYNFLMNKNYKEIGFKNYRNDYVSTKIGFNINNPMTEEQKLNLLNCKTLNILNLFHWNRVVLDEVHEIQNMSKNYTLKGIIKRIQSVYKWNISGTPFANKISSFINLMSFISDYGNVECDINENTLTTDNLIKWGMESGIVDKSKILFRRNTKQSIVDEYNGNILREHLHLLKFTEQERSIYNSYTHGNNHYDFLIKLCCHPELNTDTREMIKNCKTFDEIQACMLDYNKNLMKSEEIRIKNAEYDIQYYEREMINFVEPLSELEIEMLTGIRSKLNTAKRNCTIFKKNYAEISRTFNYLQKSIETLKKSEDELTCPICLDDIDRDNIAITKCGHKFCWDCIYETHKVQQSSSSANTIKCPTCNYVMKGDELYLLKDEDVQIPVNISELDGIIQQTKSTKVGNIIHFLKTSIGENDKVILFSQWDEILQKVGNMMKDHKLRIVYCKGSVYQRKRAISSFCKDKDVNIILLSSRNAASGINLTIANKIILLEPIYGNKEYRGSIESQAIGRADRLGQKRPIDIHRFIIENTVEQDIYNDCADTNRIRQLNIN
jgi:SNF2 family DNA or RNA helicase